MKFGRLVLSLSIVIFSQNIYPQQNPSGINWKYIDAGVYRIIFPEEISPAGKKVADLMLHYEPYNYDSLKTEPRNIPIVLINQITDANGFVSIAPFYSHWYTTPSSFDGIDWFRGLAIHEGRHMVQMNRLKDGAGKETWRLLFGDVGSLLLYGLYVPPWFMEGDAVVMETALTKAGRGRQPFFSLWQRTLELSGERYSYYGNYLGSYDSLYPVNNHYRLGYLLCSYIQRHYGVDVWDRVLENTGRYFLFYTFDRSLELETGRNISELYNDAMSEYNLMWKGQIEGLSFTDADIRSPHSPDRFDSYLFPFTDNAGRLKAVRFARDKKIMLTEISGGKKTRDIIQIPSEAIAGMYSNERTLSAGNGRLLWCETVPDPRWGYRTYSDLKMLNAATGKSVRLTSGKKFISAALSGDGKIAAGIEYTPDLRYLLTLVSTERAEEISSAPLEGTGHVFDPAISEDGTAIALSSLSDSGNALLIYNVKTKKMKNITGFTYNESYRSPSFFGKYILYSSDYSGIDNIYAIDTVTGQKYQVTSRKYGAYYPSVDVSTSTLLFNDYSLNGHTVASMKLEPSKWTPLEHVTRRDIDTIRPIAEYELQGSFDKAYNVPENKHEVKDYSPAMHSINVYGWIPYFNSTDSEFMFIVMSRDVLHTTDIYASYIHNFNESTDAGEASLIYSGFYPVISLSGGYGGRAVGIDDSDEENEYVKWHETKGGAGFSLPLNFSRGIHNTLFSSGCRTGYIKITDKTREDYNIYSDINRDGDLWYNEYYMSFSHTRQKASSSVARGCGEEFNISYSHTPYSSDYRGNLLSTDLSLHLPGFSDTQGLTLKGTYEYLDFKNYIFPEKYLFPRGYDSLRYRHFTKGSIDYSFPIVNLSFNVWKLIYFKRINGDLFFDYGAGRSYGEYTYYPSAGFELTAENNLLSNLYLAIEAGFRYSYCFETDEQRFDFVFKTPVY